MFLVSHCARKSRIYSTQKMQRLLKKSSKTPHRWIFMVFAINYSIVAIVAPFLPVQVDYREQKSMFNVCWDHRATTVSFSNYQPENFDFYDTCSVHLPTHYRSYSAPKTYFSPKRNLTRKERLLLYNPSTAF